VPALKAGVVYAAVEAPGMIAPLVLLACVFPYH
jgi:hypothetical protein